MEVYLNEKEHQDLCDLCKETNLNKTTLIRYLIQGCVPVQAPPAEYYKLIREIRAVGNSLNQTLVIVKSNGILNVPDLRQEILDLREIEKELHRTFQMKKYGSG